MPASNSTTDSHQQEKKRDPKYDALLIQLSSQRPSDVFRGMEQAKRWLKENLENRDVYGVLLDAVQANSEQIRDKVRELFIEMMEKENSKAAADALAALPAGIQDLLADADDEYYAAEYEKAIQLYRRVIRLDPENARAKDHLAKAEIKHIMGETSVGLPRSAEQYYRRARSYLAARDVITAMNLLKAAIEAAQRKGLSYPAAEQALGEMQNLITSEELRQKANRSLEQNNWRDALNHYTRALILDPKNDQAKNEQESLQSLLRSETELRNSRLVKFFTPMAQWQASVDAAKLFMNPDNIILSFVETQIGNIRRIKLFLVIFCLLLIGVVSWPVVTGSFIKNSNVTPTSVLSSPTISVLPTKTLGTITATTETHTPEPTIIVSSPTTVVVPSMTPTQATLGNGYIIKAYISSWETPNGKFVESLGLFQPVILLEKQEVAGAIWYRCSWINNEQVKEGWILGEYIAFGNPP